MPSSPPRSIRTGDLVGLNEDGRPRFAVVATVRGSRLDLHLGWDGKALQRGVRQLDRIAALPLDQSPPGRITEPPWNLSPERLAAALPAQREFAAAWLLLSEAAEPLDLEGFTAILGEGEDPIQRAACWQWLQGDQTLFRWRQDTVMARTLADVRHLRLERRRQHLAQEAQRQWQEALRRRQPLDLERLAPPQRRQLDLLRRWAGGDTLQPLPDELHRLLQTAHCHAEPGAIRHLLVDLGQWERHHLPSLENTTWEEGFSEDLQAEAGRLLAIAAEPQPGDETRLDLTGQHTVTIDDDDTSDIDDGLALERRDDGTLRLWIHVADPGRLVAPGSVLDREALRRGASLYLARGALPMFPGELASGPFSLRVGERCPAWSVWAELDPEGGLGAYGIERSWVRPSYRLSYDDGDELIELAPPEERDLADMHALLERRRAWRLRRGALRLEQPEGRVRSQGDTAILEITEPTPSRQMVAEAMILAGAVVAEHGRATGLALPYRSQLPAELPSEEELRPLPPGPVRNTAIKTCLSRGHMGTTAAPHFSLALEAYVQATSPIRRYGDLVTQRQLQAVREGRAPLTEAEMADLLSQLEGPVKQGIQISREDQRHWRQVWFEQHPQPEWRAVFLRWLRQQDRLGLVHVEELAMDLAAECPAGSNPGDPLLLRVVLVDSLRDQLRLQAVA